MPTGLSSTGRDGWLSTIAYHAVHDAIDAGQTLAPDILAERVWQRFAGTTRSVPGARRQAGPPMIAMMR
jgi:hypothetical protein